MPNVLFPKAVLACELPRGVEFQICKSSDEPPEGDEWLHQIKHDGWRVFVTIDERGGLYIGSRNGYDYTEEFELPVRGLRELGRSLIIDAEIAVPNREGVTHLDWLHEARSAKRPDRLVCCAFDLLYYDGFDVRRCPLEERIAILEHVIEDAACARVGYVGHTIGDGPAFFAYACDAGTEGIVSKRLGKPYVAGESPHWLKTKVSATEQFLVTGYEMELGSLKAIHVADDRDGEARPQGRVKFGLRGLLPHLDRLRSGYLAGRPLTLVRHVAGLTFYHEGALPHLAGGVRQMTYRKRRNGETGYRVWVEDVAGLLGLLEMGVVELHPWSSQIDDFEHPDNLVLDLDPDPALDWSFVVETALKLRDIFAGHDLATWPKLTGGKGIHVVAPIEPTLTFEEARAFIRSVAEQIVATAPGRYTTSASLALRPGRMYLDYARDGLGATAIGCYSPRARQGFPLAMPVTWKDVERGMRPNAFTLAGSGSPALHASARRRRSAPARKGY